MDGPVKVAARGYRLIPAAPTLRPSMLFGGAPGRSAWPFHAPDVRYFYLARNAVWLAARELGLDGQEVLVPAYHHGVEVEALLDAGAMVRFYRVGPRWDADLEDAERRITPRTRALYLTHFAGFPGPVAEARALADRRGLALIEDCALSLLSSDGEFPLGSTGDVAVFCLYKTLPVPNGGALVQNSGRRFDWPELKSAPRLSTLSLVASSVLQNLELRGGWSGRALRSAARALGSGVVRGAGVTRVPVGTRHFTRMHVGLGASRLTRRLVGAQDFPSIVATRRRNYFFLLGRLREWATPLHNELPHGVCPLFFPLVVDDKAAMLARLRKRGVEAIDFWSEFHPGCPADEFPEAARLRRSVLELPCHQDLNPEAMAHVAASVQQALHEGSALRCRARG